MIVFPGQLACRLSKQPYREVDHPGTRKRAYHTAVSPPSPEVANAPDMIVKTIVTDNATTAGRSLLVEMARVGGVTVRLELQK